MKNALLLIVLFIGISTAHAVCPGGQVEVTIEVHTDDYGYESYWQLVPAGNTCGSGTIFSGGNAAVGCSGGGQQSVTSGGYASNAVISQGPWCLTSGGSYDIIFVDAYGDGGSSFTVFIDGLPIYSGLTGSGNGAGTRLNFIAQPALTSDASCRKITTHPYVNFGNTNLSAWVSNKSSVTLNTVDLYYKVDNGFSQLNTVTGLNIAPFDSALITHSIPWTVSSTGDYAITMWTSNPNGNADLNYFNDTTHKIISAGPPTPNIIDDYIGVAPVLTEIGGHADSIAEPTDLDFHPVLTRNELWVVLRSTEAIGGTTVKFNNAGQPNQRFKWQKDGNAWHFMSLPTGIAFSDNANFATSPGVFDANHSGGSPFTGPTLWSSDSIIYAQPSGGNGSHLDMLHQSPYCMGICNEVENKFWAFDDNDQDIVSYDFVKDHGPGNSDHSDGIIRRYSGMGLAGDPQHLIPSHLILDKTTGILYIADTDNGRIVMMDIHSGMFVQNLTPSEPVAEYSTWSNVTWSVFAGSGLVSPSGIDLIDNRIIVSDYASGDIVIYDNSSSTGVEMGRIVTGTPGVAGVKIGPDGKIWYVNTITNQVIRIDGMSVGIMDHSADNFSVYPNPASDKINILLNGNSASESIIRVMDAKGSVVLTNKISKGEKQISLNVSNLSSGVYSLSISSPESVIVKKFVRQ